jgi:hypothetical protein
MYRKKCEACGRWFEGFTKKQAEYIWMQHMLSKHGEQVIFKDELKTNEQRKVFENLLDEKNDEVKE